MDYRVIFKDSFLTDLAGIVRAIAVHNPSAARKLGDLIIQSADSAVLSAVGRDIVVEPRTLQIQSPSGAA